ncbi:transmembrane protein 26 domain-containing protein [Ditylenchus destructor]|nr:transmembrane protein 26 domain-containing protein [Ditylenchus destructor]
MYFWAEKMVSQNTGSGSGARRTSRSGSSGGIAQQGGGKRTSLPQNSSQGATPTAADAESSRGEFRSRRRSDLTSGTKEEGMVSSMITEHDIATGGMSRILFNIGRAVFARCLFIVHSLTTIWATVNIREDNSIWTFALISVSIVVEGCYAIIMRAGDERKWFSPSVLLYILATAPPIWMLETKMCEWRRIKDGNQLDEKLPLQLLEQLLLVMLIVGRWLLPKGEISREQLSQILLAYLAISSDIVEFFDVFKERIVYQNETIQYIVLSAWTLSLLQFPFILTMSCARKMRVAMTNDDSTLLKKRDGLSQVFYDVDIWAILLANSLQDIPFFVVRLYLMLYHGLVTYTMIFFLSKNALIIMLQTYRGFVLFNDRYINPRLEFRARALIEEQNRRMSVSAAAAHTAKKKKVSTQAGRKSLTPRDKIAIEEEFMRFPVQVSVASSQPASVERHQAGSISTNMAKRDSVLMGAYGLDNSARGGDQ